MRTLPQSAHSKKKGLPRLGSGNPFQKVAGTGFEPCPNSAGKTGVPQESGAESGALGAQSGRNPTDLGSLMNALGSLSAEDRAKLVAMLTGEG